MLRRVFMWLAVICLLGLALASGVRSAMEWSHLQGGWTFYTPYASAPSPLAIRVIRGCEQAEMIFLPLSTFFAAIYILLAERKLSDSAQPRGFEVEPAETIRRET